MSNTSTIHIKTDFDCKVYDYGQELGTTKADTYFHVELRKGEHELTFAFAEDNSISKNINYIVEDADCDYKLVVEIAEELCKKAKEYYDSKNYPKAYSLFSLAAEKGLAEAQCQLGILFETGKGIEKDYLKAEEWYNKACNQGHSEAMYNYGRLFCETKDDKAKAFHYFQLSAEKNNLDALVCLGCCYREGYGTSINFDKTIELTMKAAEQNCARAKDAMGLYFKKGIGVEKNLTKAVEWYAKAAEQGYAKAQYNLGGCYYRGTGVEKNLIKAVEWFNKAAEQGDAEAQCNLGICYHKGLGVKKDLAKAMEWFTKAAEKGNATAQCNLGICYENGYGTEIDQTKAVEWYTKAAENGNAMAQYNLGICYENGCGVEKNLRKALELYEKADIQGCEEGRKRINTMLSKNKAHIHKKHDYFNDWDYGRETWDAMTDGMYGDYPGDVDDYSFLGY